MNLKSLIEQSSKLVKNERVSLYLKSLQQPELIRILEPIHFSTKNGKDLQILARNDIDVNKQILMVSTEKSITSAEFVGANNARAN